MGVGAAIGVSGAIRPAREVVVVAPMQRDLRIGRCGEERVAGKRRWERHEGLLLVLRLGLARKAKGVTRRADFVAPRQLPRSRLRARVWPQPA
jgi:hypothetical protein